MCLLLLLQMFLLRLFHQKRWFLKTNNQHNITKSPKNFKATSDIQDEIQTCDNVSNVGSKSKGSSSGSNSRVSSTTSAQIKAEAEAAALIVRQKLFKEKHALEERKIKCWIPELIIQYMTCSMYMPFKSIILQIHNLLYLQVVTTQP
ncbi:hypothetical protein ATANTOWER_014553 [Ataeniobius toweri]|uniref:Uncharacterized protein n=1 Tax=Ataeniobius toweri TaxID=208326 RepID=A0ABU7B6T6_9TELE|nr:hypothetical protein [Ataeniobius toweri]